jgi:hypothetical protein
VSTPDVTPAAIISIALLVITNAIVLFGLDLTDARKSAVEGLVNGVVLAAFLIHDAVIRHGRAQAFAVNPTAFGGKK